MVASVIAGGTALDAFGAAHSRQKFLNRVGDSSVYLTVCWMFLWPR
jgi:hypothetical protein